MPWRVTPTTPILCEAKDFVTELYSAKRRMLEQCENLPILALSLRLVCQYIIQYFGDDIQESDVIFHNNVFPMDNQNNNIPPLNPFSGKGNW